MKYVPPFDLIRRSVEISTIKGELRVNVSYEDFIKIIKMMIAGIEVNEEWYSKAYEDIGKAIREGSVASAKRHFVDDGYFEGRMPFAIHGNCPGRSIGSGLWSILGPINGHLRPQIRPQTANRRATWARWWGT